MMSKKQDPDIKALKAVVRAFNAMTARGRYAAIHWLNSAYNAGLFEEPKKMAAVREDTDQPVVTTRV